MKTYIGIDNGASGSIGIIGPDGVEFYSIPSRKEQSYTKKEKKISRIDFNSLISLVQFHENTFALVERPFVNPQMFTASLSGVRSLEAVQIVLEQCRIPYQFIDSKEWQRDLLPKGVKGRGELKAASTTIGIRLFPEYRATIEKQGDADGLLIAEYARRQGL